MRLKLDYFVSHSSKDKDSIVAPLLDLLRARNIRLWIDDRMIAGGDAVPKRINEGLGKTEMGLLVVTPNFVNSEWCEKEWSAMESLHKKIVVVLKGLTLTEFHTRLPLLSRLRVFSADEFSLEWIASELVKAAEAGEGSELPVATLNSGLLVLETGDTLHSLGNCWLIKDRFAACTAAAVQRCKEAQKQGINAYIVWPKEQSVTKVSRFGAEWEKDPKDMGVGFLQLEDSPMHRLAAPIASRRELSQAIPPTIMTLSLCLPHASLQEGSKHSWKVGQSLVSVRLIDGSESGFLEFEETYTPDWGGAPLLSSDGAVCGIIVGSATSLPGVILAARIDHFLRAFPFFSP